MSTENSNTDHSNSEVVAHEGLPPRFHQPQVEVRIAKPGPIVGPQQIAQVTNGGPIISTARKENGSPIFSGQVSAEDLVTVQGIPMRIKQALSMGFLREDGAGGFVEIAGADPIGKAREAEAVRQAAEENAKYADLPSCDDATSAVLVDWSGACARAGIPFHSVITDMIAKPGELPRAIEQLCYEQNVPTHVAKAEGQQLLQGVAAGVIEWLGERGVKDAEGFWSWAIKDVRGFSARLGALIVGRDSAPMRALAQQYLRETNHGLTEADQRTPVKVRVQGRVIETSRAYAVKQGLRIL